MHLRYARAAGKRILELVKLDLRPRQILTREAFENAIAVHAAVGGSTNALLHLPAMAKEVGIDLSIDDFDRIHRKVPVIANVKTTGKYPVEYFYYAGGVPKVMLELRELLHLDCLTVTGKTLGENLDEIAKSHFFAERLGYLHNFKIPASEIIRPLSDPFVAEGGVAILRGNIAPGGAMIKAFSVPEEMHVHVGPARVFDDEQHCLAALREGAIAPGDVMVIRYEGPRANGMPEMYFASAVLAADPVLSHSTALITDGRYSGAMKGPSIGHVSPEALDGGPIALVEEGDLIEISIPGRNLDIVGIAGKRTTTSEVARVLAERRARWTPPPPKHPTGILSLFARVATSASEGAAMTAPQDGQTVQAGPAGGGTSERAPESRRGGGRNGGNGGNGRRKRVVIADYDFGDAEVERRIIEGAGFELVPAQCKTEDEVIDIARDADGVITQYARVGKRAIDAFTRCKVIARYGTGVDIVDVDAATKHGIQVTNAPNDWCADEVADHAVALWLASARKISQYAEATRRGEWRWQTGRPIHRLRGRVLGILSYGAIARSIAARAKPFGVEIWTHDPFVDPGEVAKTGARAVTFDELVEGSDYLVIQAPLTPKTKGLFDEGVLRRMKRDAILVNTARGPIVSDRALQRALEEHWIAGAALDDIEEEPAKRRDWEAENPLFQQDDALITPHAAYYSEESIRIVREIASREVVRVLSGQRPTSPVNDVGGPRP
jgi:phosphoglycerate dehydrogenase-like enzyme